jgi:Ca2+-binding RTX toxin-like protein
MHMQSVIQLKRSNAVRSASAMLIVAVAFTIAAIEAGPAKAAPAKLSDGVLTITGTNERNDIALRLKPAHPGIVQVDFGSDGRADFSFKRARIDKIVVHARGGADTARIDEVNGVFTDTIPTRISGEDGADTLLGGSGAELLRGGDGADSLDGNVGSDRAVLGAGNDVFIWDPGDGSDVVEGQDGADTMRFNGADVAEQVELSANGSRLKFFRTQGAITMDTAGIERVDFNALGGADLVTVNDLTGTDVDAVNVELAGSLGGITGDGAADRIVVNATNGVDTIFVDGNADSLNVIGLAAAVQIRRSEVANDRLDINTLAGNDRVDPDGLEIGAVQLFVDGLLVP